MKNIVYILLGSAGALLTGCHEATEKAVSTPVAQPAAKSAPAQPAAPVVGAPFIGYHRYRGTVGGRAIVMELRLSHADEKDSAQCAGRYYAEQGGHVGQLEAQYLRPGAALRLCEWVEKGEVTDTLSDWQAQQPTGPTLTGTRTDRKTQKAQPFILHEDYTEAVRYEILTETYRRTCPGGHETREVSYDYLHLLGVSSMPALQHIVRCPSPAERRREVRLAWEDTDCEERYGNYRGVWVEFNDLGLLSVVNSTFEDWGGPYPTSEEQGITVYDLATGRPHSVTDWLRPDQVAHVWNLVEHYEVKDRDYKIIKEQEARLGESDKGVSKLDKQPVGLASLPEFGLDPDGIYCRLDAISSAPHVSAGKHIVIPYIRLATCVRPGTPLARLVAVRSGAKR